MEKVVMVKTMVKRGGPHKLNWKRFFKDFMIMMMMTVVLAVRVFIQFFHVTFNPDQPLPTDSPRILALVIGIHCKFANPVTKRKALSPDMMKVIFLKLIGPGIPLLELT